MGRESGGEPPQPTVDAAGSNAVPPSTYLFNGDSMAARRQSDVPRKPGSTAAATREHSHGQGVWWGATAWRSSERCCATIAYLSHATGVVTRREGGVPVEAGE